jgi:MFS family permease
VLEFVGKATGRASAGYGDLARNKNVRRILLASLLCRFPTALVPLGAILLVKEKTGSFAFAGAVVGGLSLARAVTAPPKGLLLDKYGQSLVLLPTGVLNGASLAGLTFAADARSVGGMVAASLCAGSTTPPTTACARVLWPHLTKDAGLGLTEQAYNLDAVFEETTLILGPLVVAAVVAFSSAGAVMLLAAGITAVGSWLFSAIASSVGVEPELRARARPRPIRVRSLRTILLSTGFVGCTWGAITVGLVATAERLGANHDAGLLLALVGAGSVIGGLIHGAFTQRLPLSARHSVLLAATGILCLPLLAATSLSLAAVCSVVAGLPFAPVLACQYTLISAYAPRGAEAEAFTWGAALLGGGVAAGSAITGVALRAGTAPIFGAFAALAVLTAAYANEVDAAGALVQPGSDQAVPDVRGP